MHIILHSNLALLPRPVHCFSEKRKYSRSPSRGGSSKFLSGLSSDSLQKDSRVGAFDEEQKSKEKFLKKFNQNFHQKLGATLAANVSM